MSGNIETAKQRNNRGTGIMGNEGLIRERGNKQPITCSNPPFFFILLLRKVSCVCVCVCASAAMASSSYGGFDDLELIMDRNVHRALAASHTAGVKSPAVKNSPQHDEGEEELETEEEESTISPRGHGMEFTFFCGFFAGGDCWLPNKVSRFLMRILMYGILFVCHKILNACSSFSNFGFVTLHQMCLLT